jgi:hypothetical protein
MSQARSLRIRKEPLEVELALAGYPARRVSLFLAEHGVHAFARQTVLDLLEQVETFLPARDAETGLWESFNARAVVWIAMSREALEEEGSADQLFEHRRFVRVLLAAGSSLEGEVLYSAPDGEARLVDHLNRPERFLRLWDGDRVLLVNKQSVVRIVEESEGR